MWLLLLIVAVGPLRVDHVFACAMMDTVVYGDCCCATQKREDAREDTDDAHLPGASGELCCERSVAIRLDEDARQDAPIIKPVEVRSDVDPPDELLTYLDNLRLSPPFTVMAYRGFTPPVVPPGTPLYLTTGRLRI